MEFVSRKPVARSTNYQRPAAVQRRPGATSSVFDVAMRPTVAHTVRTTADHKNSTVKYVHQQPQAMPVSMQEPNQVAVHPSSVQTSTNTSKQTNPMDISTVFESISFSEVAHRTTSLPKPQSQAHRPEKKRASKKQVLSVAVFVAAVVGTVAMGYDLFLSPHHAPTVSYVKSGKC